MTLTQAKRLYKRAVDATEWGQDKSWWADVHSEMQRVVEATILKSNERG